jgi:serine/threonine-protein phosphatase 2A regulatory subunit B'
MVNLFSTGTKKKKESVVDDQQGNSATLRKPTSLSKQAMAKEMDELPQLRDYPAAKCADINIAPPDINIAPLRREALFEQKLELCSHVFNFEDAASLKKEKEIKRQTLLELVDYVNTSAGQKIFTEASMPAIMNCVRANICRSLPPQTEDYDPEEDEPVLEPSWPHLQVVYEFFLRFIVSSEVNAKVAKKYVDANFCYRLIELFDSEDPRERDYLKTILHRIYGKFMSHRSFIRKTISNVFYRFVYETERHNGVGELLEILGSIINGFAIPLKREHLQFLQCALIPLHIPKCVTLYHQQLSYCVIQFVEKDPDTAVPILNGLIRYWPWSSSAKQVLVMNELEEILELLGHEPLLLVRDALFELIRKCLSSEHFQVTERTLFLWNNDQLINHGCLSKQHAPTLLPIIYTALVEKSEKHWNATVEGLATNVLKVYQDFDMKTYNTCKERAEEEAATKVQTEATTQARWEQIFAIAKIARV